MHIPNVYLAMLGPGCTAMTFCIDIQGPQRMDPTDFGDPLTFSLASLAGQIFHLTYLNICEIDWYESLHRCSGFHRG